MARIRHSDHTSDAGYLLTCEGLFELVQRREARFLTRLETEQDNGIRVLDPKKTTLVDDTSGISGPAFCT